MAVDDRDYSHWRAQWRDTFAALDTPPPLPAVRGRVPGWVCVGRPAAARPVPRDAAMAAVTTAPLLERARRELFTVTDQIHVARRTLESAGYTGWANEAGAIADDVATLRADIEGALQ